MAVVLANQKSIEILALFQTNRKTVFVGHHISRDQAEMMSRSIIVV